MNERQLGATLAALRMWQRQTDWELRCQDDIASNGGDLEPLNHKEIDELCEALNVLRAPRLVLEITMRLRRLSCPMASRVMPRL